MFMRQWGHKFTALPVTYLKITGYVTTTLCIHDTIPCVN